MKEKILEILMDFSKPEKKDNYEQRVIRDNDFEELANTISEKL